MKKMLGILSVSLVAGVAMADTVIAPVSTTIEDTGSGSWLQFEPRWLDGSGLTDASIVETGDVVPTVWPEHISGYNLTRVERIRNAAEFETLTFDLGGTFELGGMVLWNSTELGQTERGFENTVLSFSTDGGTTFLPATQSLTWTERIADATASQVDNPVDPITFAPEVQMLNTSVEGVTHVRMVVDNFSTAGANNITLASELRFIAVPEPATLGLITAFGGGILFIRRRFMI